MTQRNSYLLQILEKIGAPLLVAIENKSKLEDEELATTIAGLLSKSVQSGIEISRLISKDNEATDDSVRLAATSLASHLIASQYGESGKAPEDSDLKRLNTALKAVMVFSDNFTPSDENTARLENIEATGKRVDSIQFSAQYIHAILPVIEAVTSYSFGRQEQALVSIVGQKLSEKALSLREALSKNADEGEQKRLELAIVAALSKVYQTCHEQETKRLTAMSTDEMAKQPTDADGDLSLDGLWKNFDTRILMLESLATTMLSGEAVKVTSASTSKAPTPPASSAPSMTPPTDKPEETKPAEPVSKPTTEESQSKPAPMSFFGKKQDASESTPKPSSEESPPPPTEPKPAEEKPQESDSSDSKNEKNPQSNPMSFFKKDDE